MVDYIVLVFAFPREIIPKNIIIDGSCYVAWRWKKEAGAGAGLRKRNKGLREISRITHAIQQSYQKSEWHLQHRPPSPLLFCHDWTTDQGKLQLRFKTLPVRNDSMRDQLHQAAHDATKVASSIQSVSKDSQISTTRHGYD